MSADENVNKKYIGCMILILLRNLLIMKNNLLVGRRIVMFLLQKSMTGILTLISMMQMMFLYTHDDDGHLVKASVNLSLSLSLPGICLLPSVPGEQKDEEVTD